MYSAAGLSVCALSQNNFKASSSVIAFGLGTSAEGMPRVLSIIKLDR